MKEIFETTFVFMSGAPRQDVTVEIEGSEADIEAFKGLDKFTLLFGVGDSHVRPQLWESWKGGKRVFNLNLPNLPVGFTARQV